MDECKNNLNMDMSEKVNTNNEIMTDKDSNADKKIEQESLRTDIFRALSTLTDREQKILKLFF
jgi:DNA-directed RNA polymerase specialized sigma subunit